jgi:hypothetical protein
MHPHLYACVDVCARVRIGEAGRGLMRDLFNVITLAVMRVTLAVGIKIVQRTWVCLIDGRRNSACYRMAADASPGEVATCVIPLRRGFTRAARTGFISLCCLSISPGPRCEHVAK